MKRSYHALRWAILEIGANYPEAAWEIDQLDELPYDGCYMAGEGNSISGTRIGTGRFGIDAAGQEGGDRD
jgi:hypothetical protein